MKVTRKLILGIVAAIVTVTVVNTGLRISRERTVFREDTRRDHDFVGRALRTAWLDVYRMDGAGRADAMITDVDSANPSVDVRARIDGPCFEAPRGDLERGVTSNLELQGWSISCYPVRTPGGTLRVIEVRESLQPQRRFEHDSILRNSVIGVITVLVSALVTALLGAHFVGEPVRALRAKARRVGAGDLTGPLRLHQDDEIAELAMEINAMCERLGEADRTAEAHHQAKLRAMEQLRHADRLRTVGQLASGLAHELGTPLNVVLGHAGLLGAGDSSPEDVRESARVIAEQTQKMTALIRQLLDFARRKGPSLQPTGLADVVSRTLSLLAPMAQKAGVRFTMHASAAPDASGDPGQLQQVLTNLLVNAIHAMPDGGEVTITVGERDAEPPPELGSNDRRWHFLAVEDEGTGIPTEDLARVFEPFFTTKEVGEGTGLGLSVAYSIARDHGGWIAAERRSPRGSRFTLFLPRAPERPSVQPRSPSSSA
jgi:two-component system, NtrC family, sensor kinase